MSLSLSVLSGDMYRLGGSRYPLLTQLVLGSHAFRCAVGSIVEEGIYPTSADDLSGWKSCIAVTVIVASAALALGAAGRIIIL